jgi:EAL domain-containing protein (putative c-di-GMP-specific phosphodiesterase class I)
LTRVKVDRAFVDGRSIDPQKSAIVVLADALGVETTDEGVEKQDQLASLRKLGRRRIQAFDLARPIPETETNHLLAKL